MAPDPVSVEPVSAMRFRVAENGGRELLALRRAPPQRTNFCETRVYIKALSREEAKSKLATNDNGYGCGVSDHRCLIESSGANCAGVSDTGLRALMLYSLARDRIGLRA